MNKVTKTAKPEEIRSYYDTHAVSATILKSAYGSDAQIINTIRNAYGGEDTASLKFGRLVHCLFSNQDIENEFVIVEASNRNTNIYKNAIAENPNKSGILLSEYQEAQAVYQSIQLTDLYNELQTENTVFETPLYINKNIEGQEIPCKILPDAIHADPKTEQVIITDLKTTMESNPETWIRFANWKWAYHIQATWYKKILSEKANIQPEQILFKFLVVCKKEPYITFTIDFDHNAYLANLGEVDSRLLRVAKLWNVEIEKPITYLGTFNWSSEPTIEKTNFDQITSPFED